MTASVTAIGVPWTPPMPPAAADHQASDTALDNYAELLSALTLGPLGRPMTDLQGGLRFEWDRTDTNGVHWDLRAVIEAGGGLYMVALGPTAADDTELYLEHFAAKALLDFYTTGALPPE